MAEATSLNSSTPALVGHHRCFVIPEHPRHRGQVAGRILHRAGEFGNCGLALGESVEVTHRNMSSGEGIV